MARDRAFYAGHPVAAVAATSTKIAAAAVKLIEVDYEVLPWVIDVDEALLTGAPILHEDMAKVGAKPGPATTSNIAGKLQHTLGDVEAGFAAADVIVERSFKTKPVHQGYIEPHACLVSVANTGQTTIWSSSQGHFMVRDMTAQLTGVKLSDVRAIPAEIGGGFGGKTIVYLEPLALVLSRKSGRPVKMVMTREEVFRATGPTSGSSSTVKIGATKDGKITAVKATYRLQAGAFPGSPIRGAVGCALSPYDIANVQITGFDIVTNRPKVAAYRAPGAPIGAFAMECTIDELAGALKMDPLVLRQKNAAKEGTKAAYGPTFRKIGYEETLQAALEHPHYHIPLGPEPGARRRQRLLVQRRRRIQRSGQRQRGRHRGGGDGPSRRRRLARFHGQHRRRDARHRLPPGAGADRRHQRHRLQRADGRQPRHVRRWHGGNEGDRAGDPDAARARGENLEDRSRGRDLGERCGASRGSQCRRVRAADAAGARGQGKRHGRSDRRRLIAQHRRRGRRLRHAHLRRGDRSRKPAACRSSATPPSRTWAARFIRATSKARSRAASPRASAGPSTRSASSPPTASMDNPSFLDYRMPVACDLPMIEPVMIEVPNDKHPHGIRGVGEVCIVPALAAVANAVCARYRAAADRSADVPAEGAGCHNRC